MSETTPVTTPDGATIHVPEVKPQPAKPAQDSKLKEFGKVAWRSFNLHTNSVTIFNALGVFALLAAAVNLISVFSWIKVIDGSLGPLVPALNLANAAIYLYVGSYLVPTIHSIMKYYNKKRLKAYKKIWKAEQKAKKQAQEDAANRSFNNGQYNI